MLTEKQAKALDLISRYNIDMPSQFARLLWPDADGWKRHTKCGPNGSCTGGGMRLAGGAYLGKLKKAGLIRQGFNRQYYLTEIGKAALIEYERSKMPDEMKMIDYIFIEIGGEDESVGIPKQTLRIKGMNLGITSVDLEEARAKLIDAFEFLYGEGATVTFDFELEAKEAKIDAQR